MAKRLHTHYDNLKVARDAGPETIRAAYRALCKQYHPDFHPENPDAHRIMSIINRSYKVLSTPEKRRRHDEWILKNTPLLPPPPQLPERISSPMPGGFKRPREPINYPKYLLWLLSVALLIAAVFYYTQQLHNNKGYSAPPAEHIHRQTPN